MKAYLPMRFIGFAIFMSMLCNLVVAQKTTRGVVYDPEENPLSNVRIAEDGSGNVVYTDEEGKFLLSYYSDENVLTFSAADYDTLRKKLKFDEISVIYLSPSDRSTNEY
ncbi:MAG: carboxypeptidase-like regulatory domain-containing protein, partial [Bacteroidia bacterium]